MAWNQLLTNLRDVLADLYYTQELARRVIEAAGLKPAFIDLEGDSITRWHNILREADRRQRIGFYEALREDAPALAEGLHEHRHQREEQDEAQEQRGKADQRGTRQRRFAGGPLRRVRKGQDTVSHCHIFSGSRLAGR